MPRRVQDIIPSGKRSIRNIPLHESERESSHVREKEIEVKIHKPTRDKVVGNLISLSDTATPKKRKKGNGSKVILIFLGSIVAIGIAGYFASQLYAVAKFDIVPISHKASINKTVVAQASATNDSVSYQIIKLSDTLSVEVPSTDGAYQESKASGKVTIYNNYSTATQRLIAGTRLATPDGNIYKITSSVTVPGKTTSSPGQISVSVIADKVGQEYNLLKSQNITMRLLGFQGTPKYDGFYAKASTDITGGFAGKKKNISKADMASSTSFLEKQLLANLSVNIRNEIKDDLILFDQGLLFSTSSVSIKDKTETTSEISMTGTVNAIVFDKNLLFKKLVGEEVISDFSEYSFDIKNLDNLKVSFTNLKDFSVEKKNTLLSNFEGEVTVVARIPIDEIKAKIIGLPLSETHGIIRSYSSIISTDSRGQVMPPWSKVPTSVDNIEINIVEIE